MGFGFLIIIIIVRFKNLWTNFSNSCRLINIGRILFILISLESV